MRNQSCRRHNRLHNRKLHHKRSSRRIRHKDQARVNGTNSAGRVQAAPKLRTENEQLTTENGQLTTENGQLTTALSTPTTVLFLKNALSKCLAPFFDVRDERSSPMRHNNHRKPVLTCLGRAA